MRYGLATAVVVATATATVGRTVVTAAAEEDDDKDYNPRAIIAAKTTHLRKPPSFVFITYYAGRGEWVTEKL